MAMTVGVTCICSSYKKNNTLVEDFHHNQLSCSALETVKKLNKVKFTNIKFEYVDFSELHEDFCTDDVDIQKQKQNNATSQSFSSSGLFNLKYRYCDHNNGNIHCSSNNNLSNTKNETCDDEGLLSSLSFDNFKSLIKKSNSQSNLNHSNNENGKKVTTHKIPSKKKKRRSSLFSKSNIDDDFLGIDVNDADTGNFHCKVNNLYKVKTSNILGKSYIQFCRRSSEPVVKLKNIT
eukprot:Pgem_evm1s6543